MRFLKRAWSGGGGGGGGMRSAMVTQLRETPRYCIETVIQFHLVASGSPTEGAAQIFKFAATSQRHIRHVRGQRK
jgi:hypothetical protein